MASRSEPRVLLAGETDVHRAPLAAAILAAATSERVRVTSAGIAATEGETASDLTSAEAERRGLSLAEHRSRPLTPRLLERCDLVLTMSEAQRDAVVRTDPRAYPKTFTLIEFARLSEATIGAVRIDGSIGDRVRSLAEALHLARNAGVEPDAAEDVVEPSTDEDGYRRLGEQLEVLLANVAAALR